MALATKDTSKVTMPYIKPTRVALTSKQAAAWDMTRAKLLWSCPAFTHVLFSMMASKPDLALFTKDVPIAATDGRALLLNPDTFFNYTLDERLFICVHEIAHCIFNHPITMFNYQKRGKISFPDGTVLPYDHEVMNKAADFIINDMLIEARIGSYNKDWLHDPSIATRNDSLLDAYKKLYRQQKGKGGQGGAQGQGQGQQSFDQHLAPGSSQGKDSTSAANERNDAQWKAEVAAGVAAAKAQGKLPAGLERVLGEVLEPQVDWRDKIRAQFARKLGTGRRDWRRPDRRLIVRDIYAPGKAGFQTGPVVVGIDTSGSIGPKELDMFLGEVAGILEDCTPEKLYMMWCDAKVHRVDECEEVSDLMSIRRKGAPGGGGTSFVPVFDKIYELGVQPEVLVYLTDGMGTFPSVAPSYPVIWGSILDAVKYPFGDVVMIPKQA